MRIDYILKAVITAEHITKAHRKQLTQAERRLLMQCCEAIKDSNKVETLMLKKRKIKHLIGKLESDTVKASSSCFLIAIFKKVFNALHFRIGIDRLDNELHKVYAESFSRHPYAPTYGKMLKEILNDPFQTQSQRSAAYKVITGFYSLALHHEKIKHFELHKQSDLIKNRTGLAIDPSEGQKFSELVQNAPAKLKEVFESVEMLYLHNSFFKEAFHPEDKTVRACLERIENYSKKIHENLKIGNVDNKPLHPDEENLLKLLKEAEKKNAQKPEQIDEPFTLRELDKAETLFGIYQTFLEKQFSEFAKVKKYAYENANYRDREKFKHSMMADPLFYNDYANTENFEKYAINSEQIYNQKCKDGFVSPRELKNQIKDWLSLDMLGEKVVPVVNQPVAKPPVIIDDRPYIPHDFNLQKPKVPQVVKQEPAKIDVDQYLNPKPTPEMEKKFPEIQTFKEMYSSLYEYYPHSFDKIRDYNKSYRAKDTLDIFYNLYVKQKEVIEWFNNQYSRTVISCPLLGPNALIHNENDKAWTEDILKSAAAILINTFKNHKKVNKLPQLFNCLQNRNYGPCVEGRLTDLENYLNESNMRETGLTLEERLLLLVPKVREKENKKTNLDRILKDFGEFQLRKFARASKVTIDESWFEQYGPRAKLHARYGFYKYCNKASYLKFLEEEVKIYEGKTSEGSFTKEDVEKFVDDCVETGVLEDVLDPPLPPMASIHETKHENFVRATEVFVDLQARRFAEINGIKIEDSWQADDGAKEKILVNEDFLIKFNTKENLMNFFMNTVKIVNRNSSQGKFTEDDVKAFVENLFKEEKVKLVKAEETKQENLNRLFETFTDCQAINYANANKIKIKKPWLEIKKEILLKDDFKEKFNSKENFLNFLLNIKISLRNSSEGKITEDDINHFVAQIFKEKPAQINSLEDPKLNLQEKKQEDLGRILNNFIDLQARKYADENNIEIDAAWSDKEGAKEKILLKEDFKEKFNTKENFLEYLAKEKFANKESTESEITGNDVNAFVEKIFK